MSYIRVWVHYVWSTKLRVPTLTDSYRYPLFDHIRQNARKKDIYLDRVNGYLEHVHCLVSLGSGQTIDKVAQLLKGESSYWFNNQSGFNKYLQWQDEYFAGSVSDSAVDIVRAYIDNQENHHRIKTFEEEYRELMEEYGLIGLG